MQYKQITELLKRFGLPCAYYTFPKGTAMPGPYFVFYFPENDDVFADNKNYQTIVQMRIELYADNKDFDLEKRFETFLGEHFAFSKDEMWIEDEHQIMTVYEMEVVING